MNLVLGCGGESPVDRQRHPDVVLLVIDTLRADRLSCYGYPRETSPTIDRLASEGAMFEDVTAQSSFTAVSMSSLMTGRYMTSYRTLYEPDAVTLADVFRSAGYRTVGVTANVLLSVRRGFDRGFELYDDGGGSKDERGRQRMARTIDSLALDLWPALDLALEPEEGGQRPPIFIYVHIMDPHSPYFPHTDLHEVLPNGEALGLQPEGWHEEVFAARGAPPDAEDPDWEESWLEIRFSRGRYDQEVRYTDRHLGAMLEELEERGLLEHAIVALAADHGECLWDRIRPGTRGLEEQPPDRFFYQEHGKVLYQELVGTPLILWGAGVPERTRITDPVENVDIFPTLVELAGLERPEGLHGRSLVGAFRTSSLPAKDAYSLSITGATIREAGTNLKLLLPSPFAEISGLAGTEVELYDLSADPLERENLASKRPQDVARLEAKLQEWRARHPVESTLLMNLPPETAEDLKALGYADWVLDEEDLGK